MAGRHIDSRQGQRDQTMGNKLHFLHRPQQLLAAREATQALRAQLQAAYQCDDDQFGGLEALWRSATPAPARPAAPTRGAVWICFGEDAED
jgi:hypothetical protein